MSEPTTIELKRRIFTVNEIFASVQGEGMRAGEASIFLRFTGCNMECRKEPGPRSPGGFDCDTEFASGRQLDGMQLLDELAAVAGAAGMPKPTLTRPLWIVATGGEPGLQLSTPLVTLLHLHGYKVAIETNGSIDVSDRGIDWITVSPKVAEHAVRQATADEVKYVRGYGQGIPQPTCKARYQLLSPAFDGLEIDHRALQWCVKLVKENPEWRLSIQMHKAWRVR